mgnify:CR=1 FL=1
MNRKIMTIDELYSSCLKENFVKFDSNDSGKELLVQMLGSFSKSDDDQDKLTEGMTPFVSKAFHDHVNLNKSQIKTKAFKDNVPSSHLRPILANIKKDEETLNYVGKVTKINKDINNKSTLNVEITNPDERLEENMQANCTVIIEKAENVVGLPVEAVQKDEEGKEYVDVVQDDGTAKQVYIKTGISDDYYVEITYGLNVGDSVQIVKSTTTVVNKNNENKNVVSET